MKKYFLFPVFVLMIMNLSGCTSQNELQPSSGTLDGVTASCDKPPKVLKWSGKNYYLKAENTTSESVQPGMKLGYMNCDKGRFTLGDGKDDTHIVYGVGDSRTNHNILLSGKWGLALYSPN